MVDYKKAIGANAERANGTNTTLHTQTVLTPLEVNLRFGFSIFIVYFGAAAACLLLFLLIKQRLIKSGCIILVAYLMAVIALLLGLGFPWLMFIVLVGETNPASSAHCFAAQFIWLNLIAIEAWTELMLAVNRFAAIVFPLQYRLYNTRKMALTMITITVMISLSINIPSGIGFEGSRWNIRARGCIYTKNETLLLVQGIIGTYIPLIATLVLYFLIYVKLIIQKARARSQIVPSNKSKDSDQGQRLQAKRIHVMRSFFVASFVHVCCLLPPTVIISLGLDIVMPKLALFSRPMMMLGYMFCPLIVCLLNSEYRTALFNICTCKKGQPAKGSNVDSHHKSADAHTVLE